MRPTEVLTEEHNAIKRMLRVAESVADRLKSGGDVETEHLEEIVEFIKVFADKCHHAKEENLLFPAMIESGVPAEGGPISVMLAEHDIGRGYVKQMAEAAKSYAAGEPGASDAFAENARKYVSLLTDHIEKEDNILYKIADIHISKSRQEKLISEFERTEREEIGEGVHEKFHGLIEKLEGIYAK